MSDDFVSQVERALADIPHAPTCASSMFNGNYPYPCNCDRERRVAERVAGAIREAAADLGRWGGVEFETRSLAEKCERHIEAAALAALRGEKGSV